MNGRQQLIEQIRQQSIEKRAQALREAARNQANNAPIAAAGASSSGRGRKTQCLPLGGLSVSYIIDPDGLPKFFLPETGTLNGKPLYQNVSYYFGSEEEELFRFILQVSWNGSLWELAQIEKADNTVVNTELIATSPDIYSPDWTIIVENTEITNISSEPGETFDCSLRYCFTISEPGFTSIYSPLAYWEGVPAVGFPIVFSSLGEGLPAFWDDQESAWLTIIYGNEGEQILSLGGTREQLPIGQFALVGDAVLTISSGICSFTPPPTPPQ